MVKERKIFRPYTDLEGERRKGVEKIIQKVRWEEGFDSERAWAVLIELGAWVIQHKEEVYREFKLEVVNNSKPSN